MSQWSLMVMVTLIFTNAVLASGTQGRVVPPPAGEQAKEIDQRIQRLRQDAENKPDDAEAQCALGEALYDLRGDAKAAVPPLQRAAELQPTNVKVLDTLASALIDAGRSEDALPILQRAIQADPKNVDVLLDLGAALHNVGRIEDGVAPLRQAIEIHPNDPRPRRSLGKSYIVQKRWPEALDQLTAARSIDEWHPEVEEMLHFIGRNGKSDLAAAVKTNDKDARARGRLAYALLFGQEKKDALAEVDRALALDPTSPDLHAARILILQNVGKPGDALAAARTCVRAAPGSWVCHRELASELISARKAPEALDEILQADRLNPGVISVQGGLCVVRAILDDMAGARKACESAIALGSAGAGDHLNLARIYYKLGQYQPALRQARIAEQLGHPQAKLLVKDIEKKLAGR